MYHADLLGGIVGRLFGVPVVWGIHNLALHKGITPHSTIAVARLCAFLSDCVPAHIVVCSDAAMSAHKEFGYKESRFVVIPNGVDLDVFFPNVATRYRLRTQWGVSDKVPIVGMVARYDPYKHHTNLIEALYILSLRGYEFRAVLVGSQVDPNNVHLTQLVTDLGLTNQVCLLGPTNDVPSVMNAIDVHVLSSCAESFGNVLIEAMACGTPCVSTAVGEAVRIVGDTGWVVPPRDPHALANAIQEALRAWQDKSRWEERQRACRERIAEAFSIDAMVQRYREVWQMVRANALPANA
jgi:glycosyltransferase involved in cell wall biosynthesis